jgi:hypothetical protein
LRSALTTERMTYQNNRPTPIDGTNPAIHTFQDI